MKSSTLAIKHISCAVDAKDILHDVSFTVKSKEIHVVMGPNGSGKSTLSNVIMGNPMYTTMPNAKCQMPNKKEVGVFLNGKDISDLATEERARLGVMMTFQTPPAIPGVSVLQMLRSSYQTMHAHHSKSTKRKEVQNPVLTKRWKATDISLPEFYARVELFAKKLNISKELLTRGIHDGSSGGEKKKIEMLIALVLKPTFAIFDEIDTGLDLDALHVVSRAISLLRTQGAGSIIITHNPRLLKFIMPDMVHILIDGRIVQSGSAKLVTLVENQGYKSIHKSA